MDHDSVINRNNDITFSDKTAKRARGPVAYVRLYDMAREIIKIAKDHGVKDDVINSLLSRKTFNHGLATRPRQYLDILNGQIEIGKVVRINRKNDENTISNKIFDFSSKTIRQLKRNRV